MSNPSSFDFKGLLAQPASPEGGKEKPTQAQKRKKRSEGGHRQLVLEVLGGLCEWCGTSENLEVDHVVPLFAGGKNVMGNVHALCYDCHKVKTALDAKKYKKKVRISNFQQKVFNQYKSMRERMES